jgi:hypothetical protein
MVVACIALVGAWGGPAFAAAFVAGSDVRDRLFWAQGTASSA